LLIPRLWAYQLERLWFKSDENSVAGHYGVVCDGSTTDCFFGDQCTGVAGRYAR